MFGFRGVHGFPYTLFPAPAGATQPATHQQPHSALR
jgi:hypothetical protein